MIEEFYFGLACEFQDDGEQVILLGNVEKVSAESAKDASARYRKKHKLQMEWEGKKNTFKVMRLMED